MVIRLPDIDLDAPTAAALAHYQAIVNALPDHAERVAKAKQEWKARNTSRNPAFRTIRKTLTTMCCGARRCGYCEDSAADEIDHVLPKTLYPELVFVWENYVYTCGLCNGPKNNQFAVFAAPSGEFTELHYDEPPTPPMSGDRVLIHPRFENPLDFLILDLVDTFEFFPMYDEDENKVAFKRADYTIQILSLNTRDYLPKARREAYENFESRLHTFIRKRDRGASPTELARLTKAFLNCNHQAVWQEMKRQEQRIPDLKALFEEVPDALLW